MVFFYLTYLERQENREIFEFVLKDFITRSSSIPEIFVPLFEKYKKELETITCEELFKSCSEKVFDFLIENQMHTAQMKNDDFLCNFLSKTVEPKKVISLLQSMKKEENGEERIKIMLNHINATGMCPLFYCARYNQYDLFLELLKYGFFFSSYKCFLMLFFFNKALN